MDLILLNIICVFLYSNVHYCFSYNNNNTLSFNKKYHINLFLCILYKYVKLLKHIKDSYQSNDFIFNGFFFYYCFLYVYSVHKSL